MYSHSNGRYALLYNGEIHKVYLWSEPSLPIDRQEIYLKTKKKSLVWLYYDEVLSFSNSKKQLKKYYAYIK